jgi:hypothetical protein
LLRRRSKVALGVGSFILKAYSFLISSFRIKLIISHIPKQAIGITIKKDIARKSWVKALPNAHLRASWSKLKGVKKMKK